MEPPRFRASLELPRTGMERYVGRQVISEWVEHSPRLLLIFWSGAILAFELVAPDAGIHQVIVTVGLLEMLPTTALSQQRVVKQIKFFLFISIPIQNKLVSSKSYPQMLQVAASQISHLLLSGISQASSTFTSSLMAKETCNRLLDQKISSITYTQSSIHPRIVHAMLSF